MSEITAEMIERGRGANPRSLANRRRLSVKIRETREKLTSTGTGHRTFDVELLRQFAKSHKLAAPGVVILGLTIAGLSSLWIPLPNALLWFSLVSLGLALTYLLADRFLGVPDAHADPTLWRRIFVLWCACRFP